MDYKINFRKDELTLTDGWVDGTVDSWVDRQMERRVKGKGKGEEKIILQKFEDIFIIF
jgi:hypothetical protein